MLTFCGGLIMAALVLMGDKARHPASYLLAGFFVAFSVSALAKLLMWSTPLRPFALAFSGPVAFGFIFAQLVAGPCLYFYVGAISQAKFSCKWGACLHFGVPLGVAFGVLAAGGGLLHITRELNPTHAGLYLAVGMLGIMPWAYTLLALSQLGKAKAVLDTYYSGVMDSGAYWLDLLIYGFLAAWSWGLLAHFYGGYLNVVMGPAIPTVIGSINDVVAFILLVSLYFYSISSAFAGLRQAVSIQAQPEPDAAEFSQRDYMAQIVAIGMERDKLFLESTLNLERFAAKLNLRAKDVSVAINQHYSCNFFEFINQYRVEHAKTLLLQVEMPVLEVMLKSGFNSTSSFYRVFKKATGVSPAQFRAGVRGG